MRMSEQLKEAMRAQGLLTTADAARLAMRTPQTIRAWCRAGHVAYRQNGGARFVDKASLLQWTGEQQEA